jgi:PAS domain S-box-containing protein
VYRAIASLRESEERFGKAFRSNPEGISITTLREGRFVEVNDAFSRMLEYPRSDLIGNNSADLRIWADEQQRLALLQKLENSESVRGHEAQLRTRSARVRQVQISAEKVQLQGVDCILGITHDVSEQRTLELQLRQSHKMEALGHLAGGVAHDFNNLLMIIAGSAQILQERGGLADNVARHLRQIISTTDRAASLTRQLLAFTRQQVLEPRVLDLNEVISDLWKMLPHLIGADIETTLSLDPHLAKVSADSGQLEQVIMNLAVNARDAMPDGGRLTVKTTNVVLEDQESVRRGVAIPSGAYVLLTVSDTGMGIAQEIQARIFEPFFTTKEMGKGTGLGLATVYGVVKQSGGFIFVDSEVGAGTTFSVYLPAQTEAPATAILTTAHPAPGGRETVLLVEDQANIREITREYLRAKGYAVLEAGSGEEALEICRCANIRALVTDMMLPGLNGPDLAKAAWEIHPDLRVIYVSGYAEPNTLSAFGGARAAFFQKPFSLDALAQKLRTMLDQ